jgi:hypothetical protein
VTRTGPVVTVGLVAPVGDALAADVLGAVADEALAVDEALLVEAVLRAVVDLLELPQAATVSETSTTASALANVRLIGVLMPVLPQRC